jgi:hypothetical protein
MDTTAAEPDGIRPVVAGLAAATVVKRWPGIDSALASGLVQASGAVGLAIGIAGRRPGHRGPRLATLASRAIWLVGIGW